MTCSVDNSICTWSLQTAECDGLFHGHTGDVHSVDCFDDVIVTGSRNKTVKVMIPIYIHVCCKIPINPSSGQLKYIYIYLQNTYKCKKYGSKINNIYL